MRKGRNGWHHTQPTQQFIDQHNQTCHWKLSHGIHAHRSVGIWWKWLHSNRSLKRPKWQKPNGPWIILLTSDVRNINTDTVLSIKEECKAMFVEHLYHVVNLQSKAEMVWYLHGALEFPMKETMLQTIQVGFLTFWPGLNMKSVNKHFPELDKTQKGHTWQQHKGLNSKKMAMLRPGVSVEDEIEFVAMQQHLKQNDHDIYLNIWEEKEAIYTDQIGRFNTHPTRQIYTSWLYISSMQLTSYLSQWSQNSPQFAAKMAQGCRIPTQKTSTWQWKLQSYKNAIEAHDMKVEHVPKDAHTLLLKK